MALLFTINPLEQTQILNGFCTVLSEHSQNSRNIFVMRLRQLESEQLRDAVFTSCVVDQHNVEFGISWFDRNPGQHPQVSGFYPVGDGELVYHPFNDVWSVH